MAQGGRSTGFYVLAGCAGFAVIGILLLAVGSWFTIRWTRNVVEQFDDPSIARERSAAVLGADRLPPGFEGRFGMTIPFVGKIAMLDGPPLSSSSEANPEANLTDRSDSDTGSDEATSTKVEPGRWVFFYMDFPTANPSAGAADQPSEEELIELLEQRGIRVERGSVIDRGRVKTPGQTVEYTTATGRIWNSGQAHHGAMTLMTVRCAEDVPVRDRVGMLMAGDRKMAEGDSFDPAGTPADPAALEEMFGYFRLCGEQAD